MTKSMFIKFKYNRIAFFVISSFFLMSYTVAQEYYVATGNQLNIREYDNKKSLSLGILNKGDQVLVYEIVGEWAKIKFNDLTGYVSINYIEKINKKSSSVSNRTTYNSSKTTDIFFLVVFAFFAILIWVVYVRFKKKCKKCGKWNAMKVFKTELLSEKPCKIKKTEHEKDSQGKIIKTREVYIDGTVKEYRDSRICKYCQNKDTVYWSERKEN